MTNTVRVSLKILGFQCEPEAITRLIGLEPTKAWRQGDLIPRTILPRKASGWELLAIENGGPELAPQMELLFSQIRGREALFSGLPQEARVELSIVVYARESVPALHLSKETIEYLGQLRSAVDFDLYCLMSDQEDE